MDSYRILLFLHILAALVGLGATFAFPFLQAFAQRNGVAATRMALRAMSRIEKLLVIPGAALVLLFGIGLIFNDTTGYSDDMPRWLEISIVWFVIAFAVAGFVQRRTVDAAIESLEGVADGPELPDAYKPLGQRIQIVGGLLGLSVLGILFLMVWGREGGF